MSEPRPIGGKGTHDAIQRVLQARPPAKVLDCPCGEGVLAMWMRDKGWDVSCCDLDAGNLKASGFPFRSADLNRELPYADGEFEVVLCANGLHRLYNPGGAISEFARILKPGGTLFLNLNNYSAVDRRLRFLLYGSLDNSLNSGLCKQTVDVPEANVRIPLLLPRVANLLKSAGFCIRGRWASGVGAKNAVLFPVALALKLAAFFVPPRSRRRNHLWLANCTAAFPGGRYILLEATRD